MQYQIQGQPYPVAVLTLQPEESVLCQKGAMSWMTPNMEMATKGGGLGKMFSRALTGEAMFQNQYTAKGGTGMIAFSSALPGGDHARCHHTGASHRGAEIGVPRLGGRRFL